MAEIFLSFTHIDNARLSVETQGWIDVFHEALQLRIDALRGLKTPIWHDPALSGNDVLTDAIAEELREAKLFVSVLSPGYFNSEWCAKELLMFLETARRSGGVKMGTKTRIIKAIKLPDAREVTLFGVPELIDSLGYAFYKLSPAGAPLELDPRTDQEFHNKVNDLAYTLKETLNALPGSGDVRPDVVRPTGTTIYLAETSFDMVPQRDSLMRQLKQAGYQILPEAPIRADIKGYCQRVLRELKQCQLSLHVVGTGYGVVPEGELTSIVSSQYNVAGQHDAAGDFIRIPWMATELRPEDERQRAFVDGLGDDPRLLITSIENVTAEIKKVLTRPNPRAIAAPSAPLPVRSVYLVYDSSDEGAAQPVGDDLFRRGFEVLRPLQRGSARELRTMHEDNLETCDAVLIVYGNASEFWLKTKQNDVRKSLGRTRGPVTAAAVLLANPATSQKCAFQSNAFLTIAGFGAVVPTTLDAFVNHIGAARETSG